MCKFLLEFIGVVVVVVLCVSSITVNSFLDFTTNPDTMIKFVVCMLYEIMLNTCVTLIYFFIM